MRLRHTLPLLPTLISGMSRSPEAVTRTWDFEYDQLGKCLAGFTDEVGRWEVAADGDNHVLSQQAQSDRRIFNVTLVRARATRTWT